MVDLFVGFFLRRNFGGNWSQSCYIFENITWGKGMGSNINHITVLVWERPWGGQKKQREVHPAMFFVEMWGQYRKVFREDWTDIHTDKTFWETPFPLRNPIYQWPLTTLSSSSQVTGAGWRSRTLQKTPKSNYQTPLKFGGFLSLWGLGKTEKIFDLTVDGSEILPTHTYTTWDVFQTLYINNETFTITTGKSPDFWLPSTAGIQPRKKKTPKQP